MTESYRGKSKRLELSKTHFVQIDSGPDCSKNNGQLFAVAFFTLLTFIVLYVLKSLDDSRFTSWDLVFTSVNATRIVMVLAAGTAIASCLLNYSFPEKYPVVSLFTGSYLLAALSWGEPEAIVDASRYFTDAKHLENYGIAYFLREWGLNITVWTDMPLVPFLYGLIFRFAGEERVYIQSFITMLFSMTVVLTYLTGKILWDKHTGLFGAMLLPGIPYIFSQIPLMLVDIPAMFFLMLSIYTFILALEEGRAWIVASSLAIAATCYVKYSAWLMLTVLIVIFLVFIIGRIEVSKRVTFYRGALTFLIAGLIAALFFIYKYDIFSDQVRLLLDYQRPGLKRWGESFIAIFLYQVHPFITVAAILSAYRAFRKRDLKYFIILWLVLIVLILQIRRIRYLIMVFPMLSLMASYGLMQIRNRVSIKYIALCIVMFSTTIAILGYIPYLKGDSSANLKDAGAFLDSLQGDYIEVVTRTPRLPVANHAVSVPLLDLFTGKKISYIYQAGPMPDADEVMTSPLRFMWEYRNPEYYSYAGLGNKYAAIAVISGDRDAVRDPELEQKVKRYKRSRVFNTGGDEYEYQTFVTVYY